MGETFTNAIEEESESMDVENIFKEGKEFFDKMAHSFAEGRTLLEKRQDLQGTASAVATQNNSKNANNQGEKQKMDLDKVVSGLQKLRAFKGDIKLSEAEKFIDENRDMVKKAIDGDLA